MENYFWWKTIFDWRQLWRTTTFARRQLFMEDNLWWKMDGGHPLMEDNIWSKTTFYGNNLSWKITIDWRGSFGEDILKCKMTYDEKQPSIEDIWRLRFAISPWFFFQNKRNAKTLSIVGDMCAFLTRPNTTSFLKNPSTWYLLKL